MFRSMSHMFLMVAVAASFAVTANDVHAARPEAKVEVAPATTPDAFAAQSETVRQSMAPGERYGDITPADRKTVEADMAKIASLLEQRGSVEKLRKSEWVLLVNAQENANALLTKNDGDRLICRYETRTGSHMRVKTCQTASEIADTRRQSHEWIQEFGSHYPQMTPCPGRSQKWGCPH